MVSPLIHAERHIVRALRDAGANSRERAQPVMPRRLIEHRALSRLVAAGAVLDAGGQRYYLDLAAYRAHRSRVRKRALSIIAVILSILAALSIVRCP